VPENREARLCQGGLLAIEAVVAHGVPHDVVGDFFAEARSDNIRIAEVDPAVDAGVDDLSDTLAEGSPGVVEAQIRRARDVDPAASLGVEESNLVLVIVGARRATIPG
jgi:hypothetical protein